MFSLKINLFLYYFVKVDDATEKYLKEFAENQTKLLGLDSGTKSVNQEEDDRQLRAAFKAIIEKNAPEMLNMVPEVEAGLLVFSKFYKFRPFISCKN